MCYTDDCIADQLTGYRCNALELCVIFNMRKDFASIHRAALTCMGKAFRLLGPMMISHADVALSLLIENLPS